MSPSFAPAFAKRIAVARPTPADAPVMTTTGPGFSIFAIARLFKLSGSATPRARFRFAPRDADFFAGARLPLRQFHGGSNPTALGAFHPLAAYVFRRGGESFLTIL